MNNEERLVKLLREAETKLDAIETYACVVLCQERVGGVLGPQERIESLFRAPDSVYLRWREGPAEGLQTSHVLARDGEGRFMAYPPGVWGMLGAITLDCDSPVLASMSAHHFHTHETSVHSMARLTCGVMATAQEKGTIRVVQVDEVDDPWLGGRTTRFEAELSDASADAPRWRRATLYFDHVSGLPLHLRLEEEDGQLFGEYAFTLFTPGVEVLPDAFELRKL